jgi:hypothetical protein
MKIPVEPLPDDEAPPGRKEFLARMKDDPTLPRQCGDWEKRRLGDSEGDIGIAMNGASRRRCVGAKVDDAANGAY